MHAVEQRDAAHELLIRWPWWLHPAWALTLLTGSMALLAVLLPYSTYREWNVPKYLSGSLSLILLGLIAAMLVGILIGTGGHLRRDEVSVRFTTRQVQYLRQAYRLLFMLTLLGYVVWFASAYAQGVSYQNLTGVLSRESGAISNLKELSRPIGGVTTMTQFGPLVVAIGAVLYRLRLIRRRYLLFLLLATVRTLFYAERLALIEVALPLMVIAALTVHGTSRRARFVRIAPLVATPVLWLLFAASEFTRSWVYYQGITTLPFHQWVSLRLAGYYTTSFNNSALMVESREGLGVPPYFAVEGFWNAPFVSSIVDPPTMYNSPPGEWWASMLDGYANPEFNNTGSFLITFAEFGLIAAILFWLLVGIAVGRIVRRGAGGSVPALLAVATLFVGLLELPRFMYWTQGRAVPLLLGLVLLAWLFPRSHSGDRVDGAEPLSRQQIKPAYTR